MHTLAATLAEIERNTMKISLELRPDLTCSICFKPITDVKRANIFWRSRERGHPMIAVAHGQTCDTPDLWRRYSTWEHLYRFLDRQEEMRLYFLLTVEEFGLLKEWNG